jgi:hypothetical protein
MSIACAEFEPVTQGQLVVPRTKKVSAALMHCLVVAEDAERCELLADAAHAAGWEVAAYVDASKASVAANRTRYALALVDLDPLEPGRASVFGMLTEQLSAAQQSLLIVCGTDGNAQEEIWARQLGVWLYLPGVDASCDLTSLFSDAKHVAHKLAAPSELAYARTA